MLPQKIAVSQAGMMPKDVVELYNMVHLTDVELIRGVVFYSPGRLTAGTCQIMEVDGSDHLNLSKWVMAGGSSR